MPRALANAQRIKSGLHVTLGEIADIVEKRVDILGNDIRPGELRRLIEGQDIRAVEGIVIPQRPERCWRLANRKSRDMYVLQHQDIIVGLVRPERRNIGVPIVNDSDMIGAPDGIAVVRPKPTYAEEYPWGWIFAALRSESCRLQFWTESGGTSYGKLTLEQIRSVLLPVPPLEKRQLTGKLVDDWAARMEQAYEVWGQIGSHNDRRAITNSPIFGLEGEDEAEQDDIDEMA